MKLRISTSANEELAEAAYYYLEESPQAGIEFEEAIEMAFEDIAEFPFRFPIHSGQNRVKVLSVFPFSIYYRIKADEVEILSVAHHARRPGY